MTEESSALSPEATLNALSPGVKLKANRYEIGEVLGHGDFGITYRARDASLQVGVAIKEYLPWGCSAFRDQHDNLQLRASDRDFKRGLESFVKRIRTLYKFTHPNIVKVYDCFKAKGTAYLVAKYEPGDNLADFLEHQGRLQEKKILEIIFPLLEGLGMVHVEGMVHRDIKPSNIIVRPDGSPCLLDLGVAPEAISKQQLSPSSTNYSSPERLDKHGKQGPWTDIYALGAVCYRIVSGQQPKSALSRLEALQLLKPDPLHPAQEVGKGRYRRGILKAIDCALRLDPAQRPQNTLEWRGMVVPIGVEAQVSERAKGRFLGKLRHMFRSLEQDVSRPTPKAEPELAPALEEAAASASDSPTTESRSALLENNEARPTESVDYSADERAESPSSPEVDRLLSETENGTAPESAEFSEPLSLPGEVGESLFAHEKAAVPKAASIPEPSTPLSEARQVAASARGEHAEPVSKMDAGGPVPATDEPTLPAVGGLPPRPTTEPAVVMPKPRSTVASARTQSTAAPQEVEPSAERPAGVGVPEKEIGSPAKTDDALATLFENSRDSSTAQSGWNREAALPAETPPREPGLDKLFETSGQPSSAQSGGAAEPTRPLETPAQTKDWASLFEVRERPRPTGDIFLAMQPSLEESPVRTPPQETKAAAESPVSAVAAYNARAFELFRDRDYEGALAELEAARALEPENRMLLANIKRIKQQLQGPTEREGDPWATS